MVGSGGVQENREIEWSSCLSEGFGCFVDVAEPFGAAGYDASVGADEDEVGQFPDAPLLYERAGEAAIVAVAGIVDAVALFEVVEALFVGVKGIADEFDVLAFRLELAPEPSCAVECALAAASPACPEGDEESFAFVVVASDGAWFRSVAGVSGLQGQ